MAYVVPNTTIKILRDIRIDSSYLHTIWFITQTAQYNYFSAKAKYTLANYSYQRVSSNVIRVGLTQASLRDCSYIMFQNTAYESKWFYAFITNTEYVNDNTTDIYYVVDDIQSWLFDFTLLPTMIERRHVTSNEDTIGANINPEPFQLQERVYDVKDSNGDPVNIYQIKRYVGNIAVVQVADVDSSIGTNDMTKYDNNYSGTVLYRFHTSTTQDITDIRTFLSGYSQRPDAIVGIYLLPENCLPAGDRTFTNGSRFTFNSRGASESVFCYRLTGTEQFGSYTPKNKKLYTYPYNMYEIYTHEGQKMKLRFEFFYNLSVMIKCLSTITLPVQIMITPTNYKGYGKVSIADYTPVYEEYLTISNIPICSWTNDYYSSWISQNALPLAVGTALTVGGVLAPAVNPTWEATLTPGGELTQRKIGHFMDLDPDKQKHSKWFDYDTDSYAQVAENAVDAAPNVVSALQQMYVASIHADQFRGNANTNNVGQAQSVSGVYGHRAHIPEQQARMIDDYFEKYGYAIGRIETPNTHIRSHWTYIKTKGCTISANCPSTVKAHIQLLFDRGITWWANGDEVGDYSLNNHS